MQFAWYTDESRYYGVAVMLVSYVRLTMHSSVWTFFFPLLLTEDSL